jgi:hypothetical protein
MDKPQIKLVVNSLMLLSVLVLVITGVLMDPTAFRLGLYFRGPEVVTLHDVSSISFVILLAIHIFYLNLEWFKQVLFKKK